MANKKLVVANWKMNPESLNEAKKIFVGIKRYAKKIRKVRVVVCPPFLYVGSLASSRASVELGAQDVFWEREGSFTGEVSPVQLAKEKVSYCIVGHSERRELGETDKEVNKKIKALFKVGIIPVLCIGEKDRDHDGFYLAFVKDEIKEALKQVKQKDLSKIVIAYEPIWAIGKKSKGVIAGDDLHEMTIYIRKVLSDLYSHKTAFNVPILYGGSVDEFNAENIIKEGGVQGFLVGRASLNTKSFMEIVNIVNNS